MSEKLEIYNMDSELEKIQDRREFYTEIRNEFQKTNVITRKVKAIRLLLMNSSGRIYLQKRSKIKSENPGLYDKTVGGHVTAGDSFNLTTIRECAEELGFPATILEIDEFQKAVQVTDLNIIGIFRKVEYISDFISKRILQNGSVILQPYMTTMYIGYYDGPIKFVDGESSGIEVFSLDELKQEIQENPNKFTEDIKYMVNKYQDLLISTERK